MNLEEYKIIFERRANRFLNIIKEATELVFVRINIYNYYTSEEEINNFVNEIYSINSAVKIKFLMIHTVDENTNHKILDDSKIHNITFIQKVFLDKDCPDEYLKDNKIIQQQFLEYLQEIGINTDIKSNTLFLDTS
jgi:pyruvate-formate lyase-activating enzyme